MGKFRIGLGVSGGIAARWFVFGVIVFLAVTHFANPAYSQTDVFSERSRISLSDNSDIIRIAKFNSDGTKLLLVGRKTAEVYSSESGEKISSFVSEEKILKDGDDFFWQPGGSRILQFGKEFSKEAVAKIWDADSGKLVAELKDDRGVQVAEWNVLGDRILTVGGSEAITFSKKLTYSIYDQNGKVIRMVEEPIGSLRFVAFSSSGKKLIGSYSYQEGKKSIRIIDVDSGRVEKSYDHNLTNTSSPVYAAFSGESPDGKYLCGQIESSVGVTCWRSDDDSKPIYTFIDNEATGNIRFLGFSPDSKSFAILVAKLGKIELIDAATGRANFTLTSPNKLTQLSYSAGRQWLMRRERIYGDLWSLDAKFFAFTDVVKEIGLWNTGSGKMIWSRRVIWKERGVPDQLRLTLPIDFEVFRFNPANGLLLSTSGENIKVTDPANGTVLFEIKKKSPGRQERGFRRQIPNWSPDGKTLMTIDESNRSVIMWDVNK